MEIRHLKERQDTLDEETILEKKQGKKEKEYIQNTGLRQRRSCLF